MALFSRTPAPKPARAIAASAARIEVTDAKAAMKLRRSHQEWQGQAWAYIPLVGEYRFAVGFVRHSVGKVRLFAAGTFKEGQRPVPIHELTVEREATETEEARPALVSVELAAAAEDAMARLATGQGGQGEIMERLAGNLFVAGDAYLIGREVVVTPAVSPTLDNPVGRPAVTEERWEVRSEAEVIVKEAAEGQVQVHLARHPGDSEGEPLAPDAFFLRVWHSDLQFSDLSDSNVRAALPLLEELVALGQSIRAAHRSRLSAGMLFMPEELSFATADGSAGQLGEDEFDIELMESMTRPIEDEGDASAVVPLVVRGPGTYGAQIRLIELGRKVTAEDTSREEALVRRLARTLDLPVEKVLGSQQTTFANAEQIDQDTYDEHLEPLVDSIVSSLVHGYLRASLLAQDFRADEVALITIGTDLSDLVSDADPGPAADIGHATLTLSDNAWRRAHGFTDEDAPSDEERLRRLATNKAILTGAASLLLLEQAGLVAPGTAEALAALDNAEGQATGPVQEEQTPEEEEPVVAAALAAGDEATDLSDLAADDQALMDRLLVAASVELSYVLSRAGARLRTAAQRDSGLRASIDGTPNHLVAAVLGPDQAGALADDDELLDGAFGALALSWSSWVAASQEQVVATAADLGALDEADQAEVVAVQEEDRNAGWFVLLAGLLTLARSRMYDPDPGIPNAGEFDPSLSVSPGTVRAALARAGGDASAGVTPAGGVANVAGEPPGGVSTGQTARQAFARAGLTWVGYRWVYGDAAARRQPFEPHRALDGLVVGSWNDPNLSSVGDDAATWMGNTNYYPGDHSGCRCSFVPVTSADG